MTEKTGFWARLGQGLRQTKQKIGACLSNMAAGHIDENTLDAAIATKLPAIKELFGYDTTGDLLADTGIAYNLETLTRPYVETGGIISLKTNTVNSRIGSEQRRIDTMDRQLAAKETELKIQYAQMENAFNRMEQMGQSLDNFSRQNNYSNNNR